MMPPEKRGRGQPRKAERRLVSTRLLLPDYDALTCYAATHGITPSAAAEALLRNALRGETL